MRFFTLFHHSDRRTYSPAPAHMMELEEKEVGETELAQISTREELHASHCLERLGRMDSKRGWPGFETVY